MFNFRAMKTLLAILLSFVMTEAPVLAIHGGYTLGSSTDLTGSYAGVLVPISDSVLVANSTDFGANSLGLFTLSVPETGLGSGSVVLFSNGRTFSGSIQVLPDPNTAGGLTGIMTAAFNYSLTETLTGTDGVSTVTTIPVTANAQGAFNAVAANDPTSQGPLGVSLTGSATVNVDQGLVSLADGTPVINETIVFAVDGFQQSNVPSTTSSTGT
jgi:hypothetical protein